MTPRTHPVPPRPDFHVTLLWVRALEIAVGISPSVSTFEIVDLFARYRSPWRA